jgi:hypothetical protein
MRKHGVLQIQLYGRSICFTTWCTCPSQHEWAQYHSDVAKSDGKNHQVCKQSLKRGGHELG